MTTAPANAAVEVFERKPRRETVDKMSLVIRRLWNLRCSELFKKQMGGLSELSWEDRLARFETRSRGLASHDRSTGLRAGAPVHRIS